jgi:hypothetical protein
MAPSALETLSAPPLMLVPGVAVVVLGVWHVSQPMSLKIRLPFFAAKVAARFTSRGGALVDRMNNANSSTSTPLSSGSGTVSNSDWSERGSPSGLV